MTEKNSSNQYSPVILGKVEDLTAGDHTGFSDSGSGHKKEGGSIDSPPHAELPALTLE